MQKYSENLSLESSEAIDRLIHTLRSHGVFSFKPYKSGLFPATSTSEAAEGRYRFAWVRDNVHVAHALYRVGDTGAALAVARLLHAWYLRSKGHFEACIEGTADLSDPMQWPHVRFNGETLEELPETWSHIQLDAHGYFLWLIGILVRDGYLTDDAVVRDTVVRTMRFLEVVRFWERADSGHWEEVEKVSASSVGVVCAGLAMVRSAYATVDDSCARMADRLCDTGRDVLHALLPNESKDTREPRIVDSALLFLLYPLGEVKGRMADSILYNVREGLMGSHGIARYHNDSFWGPDFETLAAEKRTIDVSRHMEQRKQFGVSGSEAQWTLFDPILAAHFATLMADGRDTAHAKEQCLFHLKRSLDQLVELKDDTLHLPELYYVRDGVRVPNDVIPLYWAEANLLLALIEARDAL